jgi:hypothetical protein
MMTFENKIVVGLDDIKAVIFECADPACGTRISVRPEALRVPEKCAHCGANWRGKLNITKESVSPYESLCSSVSEIRARMASNSGTAKFRILLEFQESSQQ